jgi:hypothetical protein
MSTPDSPECALCKSLAVTIKGGGSVRWERHDTPELHYMATPPAMRRRQWASEDRVAKLQEQIDAIAVKGRVAWVDVKENGEFILYHAPHGQIPGNIPRTPR